MTLKDTNEIFADDLRDPAYAAGYLNITLEDDGVEGFLYALQKVARAHGMSQIAEGTGLSRESLYRSLSERGNPGVKSLERVIGALGLDLMVRPQAGLGHAGEDMESRAAGDAPVDQSREPPSDTVAEAEAVREQAEKELAYLRLRAEEEVAKIGRQAEEVIHSLYEKTQYGMKKFDRLLEERTAMTAHSWMQANSHANESHQSLLQAGRSQMADFQHLVEQQAVMAAHYSAEAESRARQAAAEAAQMVAQLREEVTHLRAELSLSASQRERLHPSLEEAPHNVRFVLNANKGLRPHNRPVKNSPEAYPEVY